MYGVNKNNKDAKIIGHTAYGFYFGNEKIYYTNLDYRNQTYMCYDINSQKNIDSAKNKNIKLKEPFKTTEGEYGVYLDDTDNCTIFITKETIDKIKSDYSVPLDDEYSPSVTNLEYVGDCIYYCLDIGIFEGYGPKFYSYYNRIKSQVYKYNITSKVTELVYEY